MDTYIYNKQGRTFEEQQHYEWKEKLEEECCDYIKFYIFVFIVSFLIVYLIIFIIIYFNSL
jgi:hypothetical protein